MKKTQKITSVLLALLMLCSVAAFATNTLTFTSAKVGDADLGTASVSRSAVITLTFSNNVTDESVLENNTANIKVLDSEEAEATAFSVAAGTNNTELTVSLDSIPKGSYTLKILTGLQAKNGSTLEEAVSIPFTVGNNDSSDPGSGNNSLTVVSVFANNKDLAGAAVAATGTIKITFSGDMTDHQDANFEQIGIYNKTGAKMTSVDFSAFQKVSENESGSYTILSYSNLPAGSYTLKLGKDLQANDGNTLGEDMTIAFTVRGSSSTTVVSGNKSILRTMLDAFLNIFRSIFALFKIDNVNVSLN